MLFIILYRQIISCNFVLEDDIFLYNFRLLICSNFESNASVLVNFYNYVNIIDHLNNYFIDDIYSFSQIVI